MLNRLLRMLSQTNTASSFGFSPFARDKYLVVLEKHQIQAHYYLPSVGSRGSDELCEALDALAHAGYIMTDASGCIVGKVAKARPSSHEKAIQRRAEFRVIK